MFVQRFADAVQQFLECEIAIRDGSRKVDGLDVLTVSLLTVQEYVSALLLILAAEVNHALAIQLADLFRQHCQSQRFADAGGAIQNDEFMSRQQVLQQPAWGVRGVREVNRFQHGHDTSPEKW